MTSVQNWLDLIDKTRLQQANLYRVRGKSEKCETKIIDTVTLTYLYMVREGAKGILFLDTVFVLFITEVERATGFTNIRREAEITLKLINDTCFLTVMLIRELIANLTIFVFKNTCFWLQSMAQFFISNAN